MLTSDVIKVLRKTGMLDIMAADYGKPMSILRRRTFVGGARRTNSEIQRLMAERGVSIHTARQMIKAGL